MVVASTSSPMEDGLLTVAASVPTRPRTTSTPPRLQTSRPRSRSRSPSPSHRISQLPHFSLVGALEFRDVIASFQNQVAGNTLDVFESPVTPYAGGHYRHRALSMRSSQSQSHSFRSSWSDGGLQRRSRPSGSFSSSLRGEGQVQARDGYFAESHDDGDVAAVVPSIYRTPASPSDAETEEELFIPSTKRQRVWGTIKQVLRTLFPTLHHFSKQSILGKIASLLAAPAVMLLTLTLPVVVTRYENSHRSVEKPFSDGDAQLVDFEEEGVERALIAEEEVEKDLHELIFSKWLMAVQCVLGPLFCAGVLCSKSPFPIHGTSLFLINSLRGKQI